MKAKFLLALALPIAFAACTNEDDMLSNVTTQAKGEKIASGMILKADRNLTEDATTRLNADGWQNGDLVGLGWVNNATTPGAITDNQGDDYDDLLPNGVNQSTDQVVYNNMQFEYADGNFISTEDVYKGAYFAYYPFSRQGAAQQMEITLNGTQKTTDASEAYFDGVFSISARDFIAKSDVDANNLVEKQFSLKNVANALVIKTKLGNKYLYTDAQLAEMKVTNVALSVGANNVFTNEFKINPQALPKAQYDVITGAYDAEETLKGMAWDKLVAANTFDMTTKTSSLSVKVDNDATIATENNGFVLFSLPIAKTDKGNVKVDDVVLTIRTIAGTIEINYRKDALAGSIEENNNKAIEKLVALLGNGYKAEDGKTYSFATTLNARVALDFQIDMDQDYFTPINQDIKNAEEWNAAVKFADSFYPNQAQAFKITENIEFTKNNPMTLPKAGLSSVTKDASKTITFKSGSHAIDKKIASWDVNTTIGKDATVTVAIASDKKPLLTLSGNTTITNNGTLNVEGEIAGAAQTAKIVNQGTATSPANLNVGENGKINSQVRGNFTIEVENKSTAVITVSYNSYIHYSALPAGDVIGIIDGNDALAKNYHAYLIDRMLQGATTYDAAKSGKENPVMCNTIRLQNITIKEGMKANTSTADLPWAGDGDYEIETSTFNGVSLELINATLEGISATAMEYKAITTQGTSTMNGIFNGEGVTVKDGTLAVGQYTNSATKKKANGKITIANTENLVVAKGATLNVNLSTISKPAEITNNGTINVTGKGALVEATKIVNKKTGVIVVGEDAKMTYAGEGNFTQDGESKGNIVSDGTTSSSSNTGSSAAETTK